jgi:hypothetical protein
MNEENFGRIACKSCGSLLVQDFECPDCDEATLDNLISSGIIHVTIKEPGFQETLKQESEWIPTWGAAKRLSAAALVTAILTYFVFCFLFTSVYLFFRYGV